MKPKWKPHDDPQCACAGCNAVTRDPASGIYTPKNAEERRTVLEAAGISQNGSPVYRQAVTGWKREHIFTRPKADTTLDVAFVGAGSDGVFRWTDDDGDHSIVREINESEEDWIRRILKAQGWNVNW